MSTLLIALAAVAAIVLTWFFCLRPMLRRTGSETDVCCAPTSQRADELIRAAREELSQLQNARLDSGADAPPPSRHDA